MVRLIEGLDMTIVVDWGFKPQNEHINNSDSVQTKKLFGSSQSF